MNLIGPIILAIGANVAILYSIKKWYDFRVRQMERVYESKDNTELHMATTINKVFAKKLQDVLYYAKDRADNIEKEFSYRQFDRVDLPPDLRRLGRN